MNQPAADRHTGSLVACDLPPERRATAGALLDVACSEVLAPRLDGKREIFPGMTAKVETRKASDRMRKLSVSHGREVILEVLDYHNETTYHQFSVDRHRALAEQKVDPFLGKLLRAFTAANRELERRRAAEIAAAVMGIEDVTESFLREPMKEPARPAEPLQIEDQRFRITDQRKDQIRFPDLI